MSATKLTAAQRRSIAIESLVASCIVWFLYIEGWFFYGLLSGYYARSFKATNSNPDSYIHAALFDGLPLILAYGVVIWRKSRPSGIEALKEEK